MAQDVHLSQRKKSPIPRAVAKHPHGSTAPKLLKKSETADPSRTLQLVEAAEDVFLDKGYHSATMSDVAKAAGISKKTIYQIVESKAELFGMLLAHQQSLLNFPKPEPGATVRDILVQNLLYLAQVILSAKQIAMIRLIMTEYTHSPDLARIFHQKRITRAKSRLETCMMDIALCKRMTAAEIREMVAMLVGMALGEFHLGVLVGFRPMPTKAMLERRIGLAVDLFLSRSEIFSHQ